MCLLDLEHLSSQNFINNGIIEIQDGGDITNQGTFINLNEIYADTETQTISINDLIGKSVLQYIYLTKNVGKYPQRMD